VPLPLRITLRVVVGLVAATFVSSWLLSARTGFGATEWVLGAKAGGAQGSGVERIELELDLRMPPALRGVELTTRAADPASRPTVVATLPAHGACDVPRDLAELRVTFSEPRRARVGYEVVAFDLTFTTASGAR
jgi:hypothetical protein